LTLVVVLSGLFDPLIAFVFASDKHSGDIYYLKYPFFFNPFVPSLEYAERVDIPCFLLWK